MKISWRESLKSWTALVAAALLAIAVSATLSGVHAQNENDEAAATAAAYAEFQNATLSGTNNTINVTMLPIVLSSGKVVYDNLVIPVTVNPTTGKLTLGALSQVAASETIVDGFKAGNYIGPGGTSSGMLLTLSGPGVTAGGATEWSLSTTSGATGCTYPYSATFYVGPITSNPLYPRLKKAGITSPFYSYGVMGNQVCGAGGWWQNGAIIGISQTGNALNILSFTYEEQDSSTSGAQITYVYQ